MAGLCLELEARRAAAQLGAGGQALSGGGGFAVQVACRGSWPPDTDASICPLQRMCLSVVMMGGGGGRLLAGLCWAVKFPVSEG